MRIITISREFGSGGRELGKRLADELNFDYYDKEIISSIAENRNLDKIYVERALDNHGWKNIPIAYRHSFAGGSLMQSAQTALLLEQKRVIEKIAQLNKDCIIVGRNADIILEKYKPFNIFVCAQMEYKIDRCVKYMENSEKLTHKEIERKIKSIDKNRAKIRDIITGSPWGDKSAYHITVNTTNWNIKDLTFAVAGFVNCRFRR